MCPPDDGAASKAIGNNCVWKRGRKPARFTARGARAAQMVRPRRVPLTPWAPQLGGGGTKLPRAPPPPKKKARAHKHIQRNTKRTQHPTNAIDTQSRNGRATRPNGDAKAVTPVRAPPVSWYRLRIVPTPLKTGALELARMPLCRSVYVKTISWRGSLAQELFNESSR